MGAGAVAAAGLITLFKTLPTIVNALSSGFKNMRGGAGAKAEPIRTEKDFSMGTAIVGSILLVILMFFFLVFKPVPGAQVSVWANLAASILIVIFGFLFVTVSSRIVGLIGSSANPISGMTIATLMATSRDLPGRGLDRSGLRRAGHHHRRRGLHRIGRGRRYFAGPEDRLPGRSYAATAALRLPHRHRGLDRRHRLHPPADEPGLAGVPRGPAGLEPHRAPPRRRTPGMTERPHEQFPVVGADKTTTIHHKSEYIVLNALGSPELADGKYLYSPKTGEIEVQWISGIGSEKAAAPQARLMATVISGILSRKLPWGLVLLGVFLVIAVELLGIRSLSFAVGAYLSIGTTLAIFTGGVVRWMVDAAVKKPAEARMRRATFRPARFMLQD